MAFQSVCIEYHRGLESLEKELSGVRRNGDFFAHGRIELPMPKLEVDGVGVVSFPVPETQARQLVKQAERAPFGRGEETIVDRSVRNVWQLPPGKVRLGGKSWEGSLQRIVDLAAAGLGCAKEKISAEFYKLLLYDEGGFFKAHRDTEKTGGMFGTLVVVLPSAHRGGDLVIRHAGREATVELSATEVSELAFAAFYADCEHEVRPIVEGNRLCLVYNLVQRRKGKTDGPLLTAPFYDAEAAACAKYLGEAFHASDAPAKIVWLLEHQYSPDGLSFDGLKNADAARAMVLSEASSRAGCAMHLGIVHIEEYGPAEPIYHGGYSYGYGRRSRWRSYDDGEVAEDGDGADFEVIEVSDAEQYIDQWVDSKDRLVDFGSIPLGDGELLPVGALDNEKPDRQRLTEATGNEGASFERSYHRAALVLWPQERFADVLLQAGVGAVLPFLREKAQNANSKSATPDEREAATALAARVLDVWENTPAHQFIGRTNKKPIRTEMLRALGHLGDAALLDRFVGGIVTREYDGTENAALAAYARLLKPARAGSLFGELARANMPCFHGACVDLLTRLLRKLGEKPPMDWDSALKKMAAVMVETLAQVKKDSEESLRYSDWHRAEKATSVTAASIARFIDALTRLADTHLRETAAANLAAKPAIFDPGTVVVPALTLLRKGEGQCLEGDPARLRLWRHAAAFLLARNEFPPEAPKDWRQTVTLSCRCGDCRALQEFARDPEAKVGRFRVRQDRRQHLHQAIERHGLDMTHTTERKGSPQTLVCTKTRRTFQRQCAQHKADCAAMSELLALISRPTGPMSELRDRLAAAKARKLQSRPTSDT